MSISDSDLSRLIVGDREVFYRANTHDQTVIEVNLNPQYPKPEYMFPAIEDAKVVFDVGGNIGITAVIMSYRYPSATVYTFEPEPDNFYILKKNIQGISNIKAFNFGLASTSGRLDLRFPQDDLNSGMFSFYDWGTTDKSISVEVVSVSDFMKTESIDRIDVVKIDTEGAEYDILTSIPQEIMERVMWIEGECHGVKDYELMMHLERTHKIGIREKLMDHRNWGFHALNRNAIKKGSA